jgi:hypothetical protein
MVFMLGLTALVGGCVRVCSLWRLRRLPVGDQLLPDLVTAAPSGLSIANVKRKTKELRFNYSAENAGVGVLELTSRIEDCDGDGVVSNDRTAIQRIFKDADGNGYFTRGNRHGVRHADRRLLRLSSEAPPLAPRRLRPLRAARFVGRARRLNGQSLLLSWRQLSHESGTSGVAGQRILRRLHS